jgi:hypothetical protein
VRLLWDLVLHKQQVGLRLAVSSLGMSAAVPPPSLSRMTLMPASRARSTLGTMAMVNVDRAR